jgi:transposase
VQIGVDPTSSRKRHDYLTVVYDQARQRVLPVADDRGQNSLDHFYGTLSADQRTGIEGVSIAMWPAYIRATLNTVADAREKIACDKFHAAK